MLVNIMATIMLIIINCIVQALLRICQLVPGTTTAMRTLTLLVLNVQVSTCI